MSNHKEVMDQGFEVKTWGGGVRVPETVPAGHRCEHTFVFQVPSPIFGH